MLFIIINQVSIKINQIESIDSQGLDEFGKSIDGISGNNVIIRAAFETPEGEDSTLMEYGTSNFFILHVQKVTPASLRPLNKIESQVTNSWKRKVQADQGAKEAENFVIKINSGKRLEDLAKQQQVGLVMLKIVEIIGEDDVRDLDPETIYFLNRILNELNLIKIRNNILTAALPNRV